MNTTTLNMTTLDGGVIIKRGGGSTPTPPSGGSGESGGSNVEYFDLSGFPTEPVMFLSTYSILCRVSASGGEGVLTTAIIMQNPTAYTIKYVAIDFSLEIAEGLMKASIKDALTAKGFTQEDLDSIPRLTKEQFYSLD